MLPTPFELGKCVIKSQRLGILEYLIQCSEIHNEKKELLLLIVYLFILVYLSNFKDINIKTKRHIFERKSTKTLMHIGKWDWCFSIGKKTKVLSLGMPPFIGINCIRKKGLRSETSRGNVLRVKWLPPLFVCPGSKVYSTTISTSFYFSIMCLKGTHRLIFTNITQIFSSIWEHDPYPRDWEISAVFC